MSKRNRREHGRILSVETMQRGSALDADAAVGATSITVTDAGDFDEDGGWLYIGAQVIEYSECDDDTGVITLATALAAAGEQGDPVAVYDPLYGEVVDYQEAHVQLDGEYDNLDVVVAEVAESVGDLPEGDRGKAGESCTLLRVADDEWEIVGVGGRPRKSRGVRWEQDDYHTLTADDVTAGTMTMALTHRPCDEALTCVLASVPQPPTEWTIDYDAQTLTIPLDGWEQAGDVAWVHYAYRKGIATPAATDTTPAIFVAAVSDVSATPAVPAGTQAGDVMVLFVTMNTAHIVTAMNGWTLAGTSSSVTWTTSTWGATSSHLKVFWKVAATASDTTPTINNSATPQFVDWQTVTFRGVAGLGSVAFATQDAATSSFAAPALTGGEVSHVRTLRDSSPALGFNLPPGVTVYQTSDFYRIGAVTEATTETVGVANAGDGVTPVDVDWLAATVAFS